MRRAVLVASLVAMACVRSSGPVAIEIGAQCAFCRMVIADARLAAEVAGGGEEPRFYDDIGCLAGDLRKRPLAADSRAYVVDYGSGVLIPADRAVYTRVENIATPMASHLVAHGDAAARDADGRVRSGKQETVAAVFGTTLAGGANGR